MFEASPVPIRGNRVLPYEITCPTRAAGSVADKTRTVPQLCHLIVSIDNESMALEEFILDLCEQSVTAALLVCQNYSANLGDR